MNACCSPVKRIPPKKIPVTFRAAGTLLSGQSISVSVLMQISGDNWQEVKVLENGKYIQTQPCITGLRLNQILKSYHVKFGPDPASINAAQIGGILANNSSGMSCGIHANSDGTITSARIIFNDGPLLDTSEESSLQNVKQTRSDLLNTIEALKLNIRSNTDHVHFQKEKYRIKNTTVDGLNSFIDFDDPIDMILHLMVGSEGTLGFVSEATYRSVPILDFRAFAMIYLRNLVDACRIVPELMKSNVGCIEIMDREALRSIEKNKAILISLNHSEITSQRCLLILRRKTNMHFRTLFTIHNMPYLPLNWNAILRLSGIQSRTRNLK